MDAAAPKKKGEHGGFRNGAGRKPKAPDAASDEIIPVPGQFLATVPASPKKRQSTEVMSVDAMLSIVALSEQLAKRNRDRQRSRDTSPFRIRENMFPPAAIPPEGQRMAMDSNMEFAEAAWVNGGGIVGSVNGLALAEPTFPGYSALAELAVRPEFRIIFETIADDATRKWIKFEVTGDENETKKRQAQDFADPDGAEPRREKRLKDNGKTEKVKALKDEMARLDLRDHFYSLCRDDGAYGRTHLFLNIDGLEAGPELATPIGDGRDALSRSKVRKGSLKSVKVIEPVWTYPMAYNAINPLSESWYNPQTWYVLGQQIHASRCLRFVGRPVPDMLKPAYSFGGLSLTQIALPYVNIFLQTRQSVADLIKSFSVMVLGTDMQTQIQPGGASQMLARALMSNALRDNQSLQVINEASESFSNVSASLAGLDALQAQSQEHIACLPAGTLVETIRGQVPIESITLQDKVLTRSGFAPIQWVGVTGEADTFIEIEAGGCIVRATETHPIWAESHQDFVDAQNVKPSHRLLKSTNAENTDHRSFGVVDGGGTPNRTTIGMRRLAASFTASCGELTAALFRRATKFITRMTTAQTTIGTISNFSLARNINPGTFASIPAMFPADAKCAERISKKPIWERFIALRPAISRLIGSGCETANTTQNRAKSAGGLSRSSGQMDGSAHQHACSVAVSRVSEIKCPRQNVYNIEVADGFLPEFFANGILVHNSIARIPLVKFTGLQPQGLNPSSEGEIRVYYDTIAAYQNRFIRPNLTRVINFMQLSLWGKIDPEITFEFEPLWEMSQKEKSEKEKADAERHDKYIAAGVIAPEEVRGILIADPTLPYTNLNPDDLPDLQEEEEEGLMPGGKSPGATAGKGAGESDKGETDDTGDAK